MISFLFKRKKIHLDVFTHRPGVFELFPVDYSNKFFPEWWKNLPKDFYNDKINRTTSTMKRCEGFIEYYINSITIPLWSDLSLNIRPEFDSMNWQFSDPSSHAESHDLFQMHGFMEKKNFKHLKLISPWLFKTKEDINWLWSQPVWNFDDPFSIIIPPAGIGFKYQGATNINMLINAESDSVMLLPCGTPMANLMPMTENDVVLHRHLIDFQEYSRMDDTSYPSSFTNKYRNMKRILQSKESKCPFHFK